MAIRIITLKYTAYYSTCVFTEVWARERIEWSRLKFLPETAAPPSNKWPTVSMGARRGNGDLWIPWNPQKQNKLPCGISWVLFCVSSCLCGFFSPLSFQILTLEVDIWLTNIDCWQSVGVPVICHLHCMYVTLLQLSEGMVDKAKGIFYKALQHIPWVKVSSHTVLSTSLFTAHIRHLFCSNFFPHLSHCCCCY